MKMDKPYHEASFYPFKGLLFPWVPLNRNIYKEVPWYITLRTSIRIELKPNKGKKTYSSEIRVVLAFKIQFQTSAIVRVLLLKTKKTKKEGKKEEEKGKNR